jgi:putative transposase
VPTDYERYYVRHLPHQHPEGAIFFVTTRLHGSIPAGAKQALVSEAERVSRTLGAMPDPAQRTREAFLAHRRLFGQWDAALGAATCGPVWLEQECVAQLLAGCLHERQDKLWDLLAFCIMPNHLHVVFTPLADAAGKARSVTAIMQVLKGYTAHRANQILGRKGQFWQHESYDHWVRDAGELSRIVAYVLNNPVKAGLVSDWQHWPGTYVKSMP